MADWISRTEAAARVELRTGLRNGLELIDDAIQTGVLLAKAPEKEVSLTRWDPINMYAGGPTYVDSALGGDSLIAVDSLHSWINHLLDADTATAKNKSGAKPKYDWEEYERVFQQRVAEIGLPDPQNERGWRSKADVRRYLLNLAAKDNAFPSDEQAKKYANDFLQRAGWK
ncbi:MULTISPECIES: hypothetical protein [unclassified Rhizobium]|uniref:hypothetical protein n=1 Tax=unclassified Rhizobium TaxID=2613769 RepID=UPI001620F630|nr:MULTISPECIES: hypothetical protein [unclassified Rhizobium]MBB3288762.1 hypothetical protein [Rhizobium sp. BK252]MBB3403504.1 hypothetical protein [Rhizobium sp. BK289]MBB3416311.1 hypothetical protein [Rhizobium sp. BK284]MBB3483967.1 hypothetical protein [Rhizobium sp. BK347]